MQSSIAASSDKIAFSVRIDPRMFSEDAVLRVTVWNAEQLEIVDSNTNCSTSYNVERQETVRRCRGSVEYQEVAPEEITLSVQEINRFARFDSDQIRLGERYKLVIAGLSNDNCNTTSAEVEDVVQQTDITFDNLSWATTEIGCQ